MAKVKEKKKALKLRKQGKSISDIANTLGVSKSSVSLWCQEITLTKKQTENLRKIQIAAGHKGRIKGAAMNKHKRLKAIKKHELVGVTEIGLLSKRDMLMLGIGLYWGEGVKSRTGTAALVNSDPSLLIIGKKWFNQCLGVLDTDFRPYIYVSEHHKKRSSNILSFWSKKLDLPSSSFKIIFLKNRPKKLYQNHNEYYGVLQLRVKKSTDLKYRIQGLIEACCIAG